MATKDLYPSIRPSLNLDFANSKVLDPRITFGRASAATYYDGKTVVKAEENLLLRSQEFEISNWAKLSVSVTSNSSVAPDGTTTADTLTFEALVGALVYQSVPCTNGTYTFSVYAKTASGTKQFRLQRYGATATTATSTTFTATTDWQRFTFTVTANTEGTAWYLVNDAAGTSGDLIVWGAQLEQRSQVTAYTPTTTQPVTNYIPVLQTAPAGVPRFDHNPITSESLGLLVEEQRTNLLTYSEQFDNATHWRLSNVSVIANLSVDPSGFLGGDYVRESLDAVAATHEIARQSLVEFTSGVTYTYSVFAKAGPNSRLLRMSFPSAAFAGEPTAYFNLVAGTTSGVSGASITSAGNGWWKCSFTQVATATTGSIYLGLGIAAASGAKNYTGDGYSGIYIWGAQLEAGAFLTSYIKTEASQVTRAADSAQMTGANFSSWYRSDEGTIAVESILRSVTGTDAYVAAISGGNIDNTIRLGHLTNGNARRLNVRANAVNTVALDIFPASVPDVVYKQSASYKVNDFATSSNGSNVAKTATGAIPYNLDKLVIGASALYVRRIAYYPKRLTDAQLVALTT